MRVPPMIGFDRPISLFGVFVNSATTSAWRVCVMVIGLMVAGAGVLRAQTGPGGVGTTDGSSSLRMWMDASEGVSFTTPDSTVNGWTNQAGTEDPTDILGNPVFKASQKNGKPAIRFDGIDDGGGVDQFEFNDGGLNNIAGGENTLVVVSANSGSGNFNQAIVGFGDIPSGNNAPNARGLLYDLGNQTAGIDIVLSAISGDAKGTGGDKLNSGAKAISTSYNKTPFSIYSSIAKGVSGGGQGSSLPGTQDLLANGNFLDDGGANSASGTPRIGERVIGDVAEVIAFDRRLNAAELSILHNYLSEKYNISLSGSDIGELYEFDSHPGDMAGIGRSSGFSEIKAEAGGKRAARSGILKLSVEDAGAFFAEDEFVTFGHNEESRTFSTADRPNDDANVERLSRVWRVDLTGAGIADPTTIGSVKIDAGPLSLGSSFDDYAIFVSSNADFSEGATFHGLAKNGDVYQATDVEIGNGDYVAVARLKRTVTFAGTEATIEEGGGTKTLPKAELNYPDEASVEFSYSVAGTGDFQADESDYSVTTVNTNIPANETQNTGNPTFEVEAVDDDVKEQTEKFGFTITDISAGAAQVGSENELTVSILDNDEDRKVRFAEDDYTEGNSDTDNSDPNYDPTSEEGDGGAVRTNKYTIELESAEGNTASTGAPCTSVKFVVDTENSGATPGTDLSAGSVADFRIKDENDPGGTCSEYQERVSTTEGRVYFASDATEATLKLEINEDDFEDADSEAIILELAQPTSSRLGDTRQQTTFNIDDDDDSPAVAFSSQGFSGDESVDGSVEVKLPNGPVGTGIDISFNDNTSNQDGGSTDDVAEATDYDDGATQGATVTIPEGEPTATLIFGVTDDSGEEKNEKIFLDIDEGNTEASLGIPSSATYTILDNDGVGATGPGGVGNSKSLRVWLRADKGVRASGGVREWRDQSGNGNDATQSASGNRPSYGGTNNTANGISLVNFTAGNNEYLQASNLGSLPNGPSTIISVAEITTDGTLLSIENNNLDPVRQLRDAGNAEASQDGSSVSATASGLSVLDSRFGSPFNGADEPPDTLDVNVNAGSSVSTTTGAGTNASGTVAFLGAGVGGTQTELSPENAFDGDVGEVIVYEQALNTAQRRIVANYLAAKYGFSSDFLANDDYRGDTDAGFDQNVIGIGAEGNTAKTQHNLAEGTAVTLAINSFSTGDYVYVGDTTYASANDINVNAAGDVSGLTARSDHVRYIDTKGQPTFDITIDLNELGLQGPAGSASNYRLLFRTGYGSTWSTPNTVGGRSASGDKVTFSGVKFGTNGQQDGYITIGTTNQVDSPLDTRLTTVRGTAGDDGSDEGWRYYGPPGSRDSGPVQMGEIRLRTPNGRVKTVDFRANMSYTWSSANGEWVAASKGTEIPAGRGSILFLYDDSYVPLDPELTIDPKESGTNGTFSYTGDTNVTVGDGTPGTDDALTEGVNSHLLANPYEVTYDLGSLQTLNQDGDGDQTNDWATAVQVWDYSENTDGGDPRGTYKVRSTDPAKPKSDRLVSPGQAFFLERNDLEGSGRKKEITFSADGRQEDTNVEFVGTKRAKSAASTGRAGQIKLRLQVHNNEGDLVARDRAASLYFREGAESTWDAFDAPKLVPWDQSYATIAIEGTKPSGETGLKAQESRPYRLEETMEVPLALTVESVSGEATLSAAEWWSIPADWTLTLVDTKGTSDSSDDVEHALRRNGENPYTFPVDGSTKTRKANASAASEDDVPTPPSNLKQGGTRLSKSGSSADPRFRLRVNPGAGPLPVEMAGLNAQTNDRSVLLEWTTASETNNTGFYVEHQRLTGEDTSAVEPDGWTRSGFVEGTGTTESPQEYRHRISDLNYGRHAFRLRQVDTNGDETVTEVVETEVRLDEGYEVGAPYPNPVRRQATLEITVREAQPVRIELYDVLGRRVRTVHDEELSAQQTRRVQIGAGDLSSGVYFLRIQGDNFSETQRVTVVR